MTKRLRILKLRPTEFALGMLEVMTRVRQCRKLTPRKLRSLVKKCTIDVVVAPNGYASRAQIRRGTYRDSRKNLARAI